MVYIAMLLAHEIRELEECLLSQASLKEKAFYYYLVGKPLSYPSGDDLSEIEQVCLSFFCINAPSKATEVEKLRKRKPIKGMHYSNNLIEMYAFGLDNEELERQHLKTFCTEHSTRDFFVLSSKFISIRVQPPEPANDVDRVAYWLHEGSIPDDWKIIFIEALKQTVDLIDLYIINKAYMLILDDHPVTKKLEDMNFLSGQFRLIIKILENRIRRKLFYIITSIFIVTFLPIGYWTYRSWDTAEPVFFIVQGSIFLLALLIVISTGVMPDKIHFINRFRERVLDWRFRRMGIDRQILKEKLDDLC